MMMMAIFIAHGSIDSMLNALKEIIDRKWTEESLGKTQKSFGAEVVQQTWKR